METNRYRIGELANRTGVTKRTIHYYLGRGLLPPSEGEGLGTTYSDEHFFRIIYIKKLQDDYLPLDEIRRRMSGMTLAQIKSALHDMAPFHEMAVQTDKVKYINSFNYSAVEHHDGSFNDNSGQAPCNSNMPAAVENKMCSDMKIPLPQHSGEHQLETEAAVYVTEPHETEPSYEAETAYATEPHAMEPSYTAEPQYMTEPQYAADREFGHETEYNSVRFYEKAVYRREEIGFGLELHVPSGNKKARELADIILRYAEKIMKEG